MNYPPNLGYPASGGQYPQPAAGGGLGFEGLNGAPSYPAGPVYPQGGAAPYPSVSIEENYLNFTVRAVSQSGKIASCLDASFRDAFISYSGKGNARTVKRAKE